MKTTALVEIKHLDIVRTHDLAHDTVTPVPMTSFWQIPQYLLIGPAEVFFLIGTANPLIPHVRTKKGGGKLSPVMQITYQCYNISSSHG